MMTATVYTFPGGRMAKTTPCAAKPPATPNHPLTAAHEGAELWLHPFVRWCEDRYLTCTRESYRQFREQVGASASENAMMAVLERFRASPGSSMPEGRG